MIEIGARYGSIATVMAEMYLTWSTIHHMDYSVLAREVDSSLNIQVW